MGAKDTVMTDEEIEAFMLKLYNSPQLLVRLVALIAQIATQEGIQEVVEWINCNVIIGIDSDYYDEWQAQLKKWGIKED